MRSNTRYPRIIGTLAVCLVIAFLEANCAGAPTAGTSSQEAGQGDQNKFAQVALENYVKSVLTDQNAPNFGFKDLKQASTAKVGEPYQVMFIGLNDLKAYKPGAGAKPIVKDAGTLWFPVQVEGRTVTRIEIVQIEGKWVAGEFGGTTSVQMIDPVSRQLPALLVKGEVGQSQPPVLVKIPALNAAFLYVAAARAEYLIPAMVQPERFELKDGEIYPADKVLSILSKFAQEIDPNSIN